MHKKNLRDNGVKLISAMENIPDTPEGIILESLLEVMAEYYSAELSQKVKRGMKELGLKVFCQGGKLPYGYKLDGKKIITEQEAENVKFIFNKTAGGIPAYKIIEQLTAKGQLKEGKPFVKQTINFILHNTKYLGWYMHED